MSQDNWRPPHDFRHTRMSTWYLGITIFLWFWTMDPHIKKHKEQWTTATSAGRLQSRLQIKTLWGTGIAQLHKVPSSFFIWEVSVLDSEACLDLFILLQNLACGNGFLYAEHTVFVLLKACQWECFLPLSQVLIAERAGSVSVRCGRLYPAKPQANSEH